MGQVDSLIEQRIHLLAGRFVLSVHAYAVMSNHLHLAIYTDPVAGNGWSDDEVIERWRTALPTHKFDSRSPAATDDPAPGRKVSAEWIAEKRLWLASLAEWQEQLNAVRCGWRVIGGSVQMRELAQRTGQHRIKRVLVGQSQIETHCRGWTAGSPLRNDLRTQKPLS